MSWLFATLAAVSAFMLWLGYGFDDGIHKYGAPEAVVTCFVVSAIVAILLKLAGY